MDAVWFVHQQMKGGASSCFKRLNPLPPLFQAMRIDGVAFVPAKSHQYMGRGDLHVQRVPSSGRITDDSAHPKFS